MAVHAGLGWRNPGEARGFDRRVAVSTINADGSHVVLMAEGRGLRPGNSSIGYVRRALNLDARPQRKRSSKNARVNRGTRNDICAAMENLHRSDFFFTAGLVAQPECPTQDE